MAFFILALLLTAFPPDCFAQKKVKYKDIWALLNAKQFESAEPFLKDYLRENADNPNAFLYMGMIYQEKSMKDDVLRQTGLATAHMDSAILFLNKAYQTITDKEIKRNDELYQAYTRRDIRTGEYGIKLSDIQFDIEKRIESMRERAERITMTRHYFQLCDSLYRRSQALYAEIQSGFSSDKEFYLRSDENTARKLASLASRFDSSMKAFDQYKASAATLGKTGYYQNLTRKDIKSMASDGRSTTDFYQNELEVWDYKTFAVLAKQAIENDILPMREHLISYDIEINKLREKLTRDSVSVHNDLTKLVDRLLLEKLRKYDEKPLPMDVFRVKMADLEYKSVLLEHKPLRDSGDVHLQLAVLTKELRTAATLDSLADILAGRDLDRDLANYQHFVSNTYGNPSVLKSFVKVVQEYGEREKVLRAEALARHVASMQWLVLNQSDSVPLFSDGANPRFRPLAIVSERYTAGIQLIDSVRASGYFYSITPSRIPDIKVTIPVTAPEFAGARADAARSLTYADASGQIFFVVFYSEQAGKDNKYSATVAKIYRSDGLAWTTNHSLAFIPKEINFSSDTGEFVIRADAQESVLDKNGKVLR